MEEKMAGLEYILYFDIPLESPSGGPMHKALASSVRGDQMLHMKFSIIKFEKIESCSEKDIQAFLKSTPP